MRMVLGRRILRAAALGSLLLNTVPAARAQAPRPRRRAVLTVSGLVREADGARFDVPRLEALPKAAFRTATPWVRESVTFEGARISDVLRAAGATGGDRVVMTALNNYSATMPMTDVDELEPIEACRRDGAYRSVEAKGPFFVAYNYGAAPEAPRPRRPAPPCSPAPRGRWGDLP